MPSSNTLCTQVLSVVKDLNGFVSPSVFLQDDYVRTWDENQGSNESKSLSSWLCFALSFTRMYQLYHFIPFYFPLAVWLVKLPVPLKHVLKMQSSWFCSLVHVSSYGSTKKRFLCYHSPRLYSEAVKAKKHDLFKQSVIIFQHIIPWLVVRVCCFPLRSWFIVSALCTLCICIPGSTAVHTCSGFSVKRSKDVSAQLHLLECARSASPRIFETLAGLSTHHHFILLSSPPLFSFAFEQEPCGEAVCLKSLLFDSRRDSGLNWASGRWSHDTESCPQPL